MSEGARRAGDVGPRRDRRLGQGRRARPTPPEARRHRLLLGRPDRLAVLGPQPERQGGRGLVRPARRRRRRAAPEAPDRPRRRRSRPRCSAFTAGPTRAFRSRRSRRVRKALKDADKPVEIVLYPETPHGFNADYRPSYRKDKAEDGWKRMLSGSRRTAWREEIARWNP